MKAVEVRDRLSPSGQHPDSLGLLPNASAGGSASVEVSAAEDGPLPRSVPARAETAHLCSVVGGRWRPGRAGSCLETRNRCL